MPIQSTQLLGGHNPTKYLQQYIGSALDHVVHVSSNLQLLNDIYNSLNAIDVLDDYAQSIQTVADYINNNNAIIQGAQGATGAQGAQGAQGAVGAQGAQGAVGAQGAPGIQGIQGNQGNNGAQGVQGVQGIPGVTPHIDGATGNWFIGATDTGIKAQGINGLDGQDGVGVVWQPAIATASMLPSLPYNNEIDAFYVNDTGNAFRYDASTNSWINIGNRKGATGATGAQGATGATGAAGTNGTDGVDGADGKSAYELWVALDPANNNLTEAQWLASLEGGEYGRAVASSSDLAAIEAREGQRRDVTTGAGTILTYAYYETNTRPGVASTYTGQTGKWVDVTNGCYYNSTSFAIESAEQTGTVGTSSTTLGVSTETSGNNSTNMGNGSVVKTNNSINVGQGSSLRQLTGVGTDNINIGYSGSLKGTNNISLGNNNTIEASNVIGVGRDSLIKVDRTVSLSPKGISLSLSSNDVIHINNDTALRNIHSINSVHIGSSSGNTLVDTVVIGKQNAPDTSQYTDVVAVGHNSAPSGTVSKFTGLGEGAGQYQTSDNQLVVSVGGSLVVKAEVGAVTASDGFINFGLPIKDVAGNKNDGTKVLSSDAVGNSKWVDVSTLTSSGSSPNWIDLSNKLVGGAYNANAITPFEYLEDGNTIVIRGSISYNTPSAAPSSILLASNLPAVLQQQSNFKVVGTAIDINNLNLLPTTVTVEGSSLLAYIYRDQIVSVAAPAAGETVGQTTVTEANLPTNFTFNITFGKN
jgi:hypothetical protein